MDDGLVNWLNGWLTSCNYQAVLMLVAFLIGYFLIYKIDKIDKEDDDDDDAR